MKYLSRIYGARFGLAGTKFLEIDHTHTSNPKAPRRRRERKPASTVRIEGFNLISTGAEDFIRRHEELDSVWGLIWGPSVLPAKSCYKIKVLRVYLAEPEGFEPSIGLYNPITV
jgi:hypothetical protein